MAWNGTNGHRIEERVKDNKKVSSEDILKAQMLGFAIAIAVERLRQQVFPLVEIPARPEVTQGQMWEEP